VAAGAILIMGVSGSGKSTLAALLAQELGCPFIEGDEYHSAANVAKMRGGEPLTDADRWPWLNALGAAISRATAEHRQVVASCSALRRIYRDRLRAEIGAPIGFVLLDAPRDELIRRIATRKDHYMPAGLIDSQLATLERPTPDEGLLVLDAGRPPAELALAVRRWWEPAPPLEQRSA
jgi:gluconokinase